MPSDRLSILSTPKLHEARLILSFTGWMDGGDVSTGTVERLVEQTDAQPIAMIDPEGFYLYAFPGTMEIASMFRPEITLDEGLIQSLDLPSNTFYCDEKRNLVFFVGKEPHLNWQSFADCVLHFCDRLGIKQILSVGSFGGAVPHTRQARLYITASNPLLRDAMAAAGVRRSAYQGPSSFSSFLMTLVERQGIQMASLVAEIPGYLQGTNPPSIEAVTRRLAQILNIPVDLAGMRGESDEWEARVSDEVRKNTKLAKQIRELEERYDDELIGSPAKADVREPDEDEDDDPHSP